MNKTNVLLILMVAMFLLPNVYSQYNKTCFNRFITDLLFSLEFLLSVRQVK